jgi:tetratricopeptide (TPR) repeat protein
MRIGPDQEALELYKEAAQLAEEVVSPPHLVRAALGVARAEFHAPVRQSKPLLEAALAALDEGDSAERCRLLSNLGQVLFQDGIVERARPLLREATEMARRLGDREALIWAFHLEDSTTAGYPWSAREFPRRRKTLDEGLAAAEELGDPFWIMLAELRRVGALLEMADLSGFEASLSRFRKLAKDVGSARALCPATSAEAMRAMLYGDFAEAERLAEAALELGRDSLGESATGVYGVQMFTIRREQGRLGEVAPLLRRFLDENPRDTGWRPGLALIASDLGFEQAARKAFEDLAAGGFSFPIDAKWTLTISYLAEVCTRLGDVDRAEQLYQLLLPYRDLTIIAPSGTVCCGSTARYLGMLAGVLGNPVTAEEHFEAALGMDEALQAWPWLAHTQHEFAATLQARGKPRDHLRAAGLLAAAAKTAHRLGMTALQQRIRSLGH